MAGLFATLGDVPNIGIGSIWYLDEAYLQRGFSGSAVMRTPRYEHRMLFQSSVDELRKRLIDVEPHGRFNWAGEAEAWTEASNFPTVQPCAAQLPWIVLEPVQLSLSLYFAPGPSIPRMNAQAWCAVEMNSHLGVQKGNFRRLITLHKLLERFAGRVNFIHTGGRYERPVRQGLSTSQILRQEISDRTIFPTHDVIGKAIERYQLKSGLVSS